MSDAIQNMSEHDIRKRKLEAIRDRDGVVYKNKFKRTHTLAQVMEAPDDTEVRVCGRITALRWFGKLVFGRLYEVGGEIQFSMSLHELSEEDFNFFKANGDVGDYIGVEGIMYHTNKGQLTVKAHRYTILSKALRPLPEKFHGITDVDARFRQRYLDLIVNPESRDAFVTRIKALQFIREHLLRDGFFEVETPILQNVASGAAARPFVTRHNALDAEFYLRIAPELFLKQVVECGFDRVFEMGKNFRNEGMDAMHLQEFTMLEWYVAFWDWEDNLAYVTALLQALVTHCKGGLQFEFQGTLLDFGTFERVDYSQQMSDIIGADILEFDSADALKAHIVEKGLYPAEELKEFKSVPAVIDFVFKRKIRPAIVQPTVIYNYPTYLIPLARRNDDDPRLLDMFQIAMVGTEIVKAYSELVDPQIQRAAFEEQAKNKSDGDDEAFEIDEAFLLAMEHGMPPMSGLGLGIDRFISILTDQPTLRDVVLFPQMK